MPFIPLPDDVPYQEVMEQELIRLMTDGVLSADMVRAVVRLTEHMATMAMLLAELALRVVELEAKQGPGR